jgi:hypothetical protein
MLAMLAAAAAVADQVPASVREILDDPRAAASNLQARMPAPSPWQWPLAIKTVD